MLHCFSHVQLCVTLWTVARQAPLSMGFSRQEYCSELPRPPQGDLPDPGTEPVSVVSPALAGGFFTMRNTFQIYPWLSLFCLYCFNDVLSSNDFQFVSLIHSAICNDSWIQICPHCSEHKECILGNSLVVQWLGLCAFTAEGQGSTSGRGIKILQALWWSQKKKKKMHSLSWLTRLFMFTLCFIPLPPSWHNFQGSQETLASLMAQTVKNLPAMQEMQETWDGSLGWEDPLE